MTNRFFIVSGIRLAAVFALSAASHAGVVNIDTEQGVGADTFINRQSVNTAYGTDSYMLLRQDGNSFPWHRKVYLRFDLSSGSTPITAATLDLIVELATPGGQLEILGMDDLNAGESWSESSTTWHCAGKQQHDCGKPG